MPSIIQPICRKVSERQLRKAESHPEYKPSRSFNHPERKKLAQTSSEPAIHA